MSEKIHILKCLVGSQAHGLADVNSDFDYRGVYVVPTTEILSLGFNYKGSHWLEGETDQTAYEIGHFLHLAVKCNPSILECFVAPRLNIEDPTGDEWNGNDFGSELRALFPYVWNPQDAYNAFLGYSLNQRKKMLANELNRANKYAVAYLRTLYNLGSLLHHDSFSLLIEDEEFKQCLIEIKAGKWSSGQVVDKADKLTQFASKMLENCTHKPDISKVNEFLLKVRKEFW